MKGEITIKAEGIANVTLAVHMTRLHSIEKLVLIDALCEALRLTDEERATIGLTVVVGGMNAVTGKPAEQFEIDVGAIKEALRRDRSKDSDTPPGKA